jgi:phosphomannomutase
VKEKKAKMGVALDGDADRFALVSDKGVYMTPCQIAPMLLEYLIQRNKLKGKVIQAVSMGYLTKRIARIHNLQFEEVPVGFKYIAEKMISEDVSFGAEESGGYAWKGSLPERDGVLTALAFAEMTARTGKTISELY